MQPVSNLHPTGPVNGFHQFGKKLVSQFCTLTSNVANAAFKTNSLSSSTSPVKLKEKAKSQCPNNRCTLVRKCFAVFTTVNLALYGTRSQFAAATSVLPINPHNDDFLVNGQQPLFSPEFNMSSDSIYLELTEEIPFSQEWFTWDIFKTTPQSQRMIIKATQEDGSPLPSGLNIISERMKVIESMAGFFYKIAYKDNYIFATTGETGLTNVIFWVIDVSDINQLTIISILTVGIDDVLGTPGEVVIKDNYAYFVCAPWIYVVNILDPYNPIVINKIPLNDDRRSILRIYENTLYFGYNSLKIMDITDPSVPNLMTCLPLSLLRGLSCVESLCYASSALGLTAINITNSSTIEFSQPIIRGYDIICKNNTCFSLNWENPDLVLEVMTISNNSANITASFPLITNGYVTGTFTLNDHFIIIDCGSVVSVFDIDNLSDPLLIASVPVFFIATEGLLCSGDYCYFSSDYNRNEEIDRGLKITKRGDTVKLVGTPQGGTQGTYSIILNATDSLGENLNRTKRLNVKIKPAITINKQIPDFTVIINSVTTFYLDHDTFKHINGQPLTYLAAQINSTILPKWIKFNSISAAFTFNPEPINKGIVLVNLKAQDHFGASASAIFQVSTIYGPQVNKLIPNQIAVIGIPFLFRLPPETFVDKDGDSLTYSVSSKDGGLPIWVTFDSKNQTFTGIAATTDAGTLDVTIQASNGKGISAFANFVIQVSTPAAPILLNPIENHFAPVGEPFILVIPENTFVEPFGNPLTYSVRLSGTQKLPSWLHFKNMTLSGTPGPENQETFYSTIYNLELVATGKFSSSLFHFNITLTGFSNWRTLLNAVGYVFSGVSFVYSGYKARAFFWNKCRGGTYRLGSETALAGKPYKHTISISHDQVKDIKSFVNGNELAGGLPSWLRYDPNKNAIISKKIPSPKLVRSLTIQIIDQTGRIKEEFELHIKKEEIEMYVNDDKDEKEVPLLRMSRLNNSSQSSEDNKK